MFSLTPVELVIFCKGNRVLSKTRMSFSSPGGLRGDVVIPFVDGTSMEIKKIVEHKIRKDVWSFNEATQRFEPQPIMHWWNGDALGRVQNWLHIRAEGINTRNGVIGLTVKPEQKILLETGWDDAQNLAKSTKVLSKQYSVLHGESRSFVLGAIAGDATIRKMGKTRRTAQIVFQDNNDLDYARWKVSQLTPVPVRVKVVVA